jgi:phage terminase small subunit
MRGRRPKPTRIKALTGNPGKRPLNAHEPRPEPALPECPPELGPAAQRERVRLTGELAKLNLITNLDRGALATYCGAYGMRAEAMEQVQKYRDHGEVAGRLSDTVALPGDRQPAGGNHDAHCIRIRLNSSKP